MSTKRELCGIPKIFNMTPSGAVSFLSVIISPFTDSYFKLQAAQRMET